MVILQAAVTFAITSHSATEFLHKPLECLFLIKTRSKTGQVEKGKRDWEMKRQHYTLFIRAKSQAILSVTRDPRPSEDRGG